MRLVVAFIELDGSDGAVEVVWLVGVDVSLEHGFGVGVGEVPKGVRAWGQWTGKTYEVEVFVDGVDFHAEFVSSLAGFWQEWVGISEGFLDV